MFNDVLFLREKTILFAEDDVIARTELTSVLEMLFKEVFIASDGLEAFRIYEDEAPDIVLTDIKMPKKDGLSLIRSIRSHDYKTPIVLMTSFAEQEILLDVANLSIDGYLVKPVELEKLTFALCKAVQRVHRGESLVFLGKKIFYNSAKKELYNDGEIIVLGVKEQELLVLLLKNSHRTITKEEIVQELWPLDAICDSAIKNIILRLRKKLGLDIIVSVRGIGYRLDTRENPREC